MAVADACDAGQRRRTEIGVEVARDVFDDAADEAMPRGAEATNMLTCAWLAGRCA